MKKIVIIIFIMFLVLHSLEATSPTVSTETIAGFEKEVKGVLSKVSPSIVKVISQNHRKYVATGIVYDKEHIVTSMVLTRYPYNHIYVRTDKGQEYPAQVVGKDKGTSLLVLKIGKNSLTPIKQTQSFETGDWIALVGSFYKKFPAIQQGILSSSSEDGVILNAPVAPGASGGAVVNKKGELIGVIRGRFGYAMEPDMTFKDHSSEVLVRSPRNKSKELCFAVPTAKVKRIVDDLITYGEIKRGWLGVSIIATGGQVEVEKVVHSSPAELCGIQKGDIILSIDKATIRSASDVIRVVRSLRPGQKINIKILRNDNEKLLTATIGEAANKDFDISIVRYPQLNSYTRPTPTDTPATIPETWQSIPRLENFIFNMSGAWNLGIELVTLTPELANAFKVKEGYGLMISKIHDNSAAAGAGLEAADIITAVDGQDVKRITDLRRALAKVKKEGQAVVLKYYRQGKPAEKKVIPSRSENSKFPYEYKEIDHSSKYQDQPGDDTSGTVSPKPTMKKNGEIIEIRGDYLYINGKQYQLDRLKMYRMELNKLRRECDKYKQEVERLKKLLDQPE